MLKSGSISGTATAERRRHARQAKQRAALQLKAIICWNWHGKRVAV
jgi:hypothetical protein